jgi:hypothetical protein
MRRLRAIPVVAASILVVALSACSGESAGGTTPSSGSSADGNTVSEIPSVSPSGTDPIREALSAKDYDADNFDDPTTIDNEWFPLQPGTQFIFKGSSLDGKERLNHRVVSTVTDLTKVIGGVRNVVVWERDFTAGELVEAELALFAQDDDGNVWHFGQYPEEYEDGKLVKAPAWIAGFEGARTGITMKAEPKLGTPSYSQGYAPPPINWIDRARAYLMGQETCVPAGCYQDVLVTEEFERDKPGAFQLKFYAPGVGNVRVGWRGRNEDEREVLVLVDIVNLSPEALANVREAALRLEDRAYRISDVYARTSPAE